MTSTTNNALRLCADDLACRPRASSFVKRTFLLNIVNDQKKGIRPQIYIPFLQRIRWTASQTGQQSFRFYGLSKSHPKNPVRYSGCVTLLRSFFLTHFKHGCLPDTLLTDNQRRRERERIEGQTITEPRTSFSTCSVCLAVFAGSNQPYSSTAANHEPIAADLARRARPVLASRSEGCNLVRDAEESRLRHTRACLRGKARHDSRDNSSALDPHDSARSARRLRPRLHVTGRRAITPDAREPDTMARSCSERWIRCRKP